VRKNSVRHTAAFLAAFSCIGHLAFAETLVQDDDTNVVDEPIEMIVVTGSRIPRTEFESLQPATVLDNETLKLRGSISLAAMLNEQAGFATPTSSPIGPQNPSAVGQNFVDFLGLGRQRTLTLVNGRRFPAGVSPSGTFGGLSVDLNAIPEVLVERVEIIAIGGAPIYGSDAIAGTVNVILKDDFEGFDIVGSLGGSPEFNDAEEIRLGATWGTNFGNDRGNLVLSTQYTSVDGLRFTDRPATSTLVDFEVPGDPNSPFALELFTDLTVAVDNNTAYPLFFGDMFFFNIFGNGIPLDINDPNSPIAQFDENGNLLPFVPGGGTGSSFTQDGGDGLKLSEFSTLYADVERFNFNILGNYDATDSTRLSVELWIASNDAVELVTQPQYNSPAFGGIPANNYGNVGGGPIPILIDNPFLLPATRASIGAALDVVHDFDDDGTADPTIDTDGDGIPDAVGFWRGGPLTMIQGSQEVRAERYLYRGAIGLDGEIRIADRDFFWDTWISYGRTQTDETYDLIVMTRFDQAIQVVTGPDSEAACADPSNDCVPLDVIGMPSIEALDYVLETVTDEVRIEQSVISANIGGDLFELPAGPVRASLGFEFRNEKSAFDPNELAKNGLTRFELVPVSGEFDTTEFYVETVVPLLGETRDTGLVHSLDFEGAVRFVDNSIAGEDTTWTAGLRYRPIDDIELRGNLTKSIRAPSITELFTPASQIFVRARDPCDSRFIDQGNDPATRAANCAADGITQPFMSFIVNSSQPATLSGNPGLVSETAESSTIGLILRPRFIEGFTASFDWFDIEITSAIENLGSTDIMNACYDSSSFGSEPACDLFGRNAAGQVVDLRIGFVNVGLVEFEGIQTVLSYDVPLGKFGDLKVGLNHLFTEEHIVTPGSGNSRRLEGEIGKSENRINLNAAWHKGDWTVFSQFRWLSSAVFDNSDDEFTRSPSGIDDWLVIDSSVSYQLRDSVEFQLNVDNVFDEDPPFAAVASPNGIRAYYSGIRGRYLTLTVRASF
jgi:iron complex outermembrane receptor protein